MDKNREMAILAAYYLSRFAPDSYRNLGFQTQKECHETLGQVLKVKASYIKNLRDEFDPIHENSRVGWYQRPLSRSRLRVVELFQNSTEYEIRYIVDGILRNSDKQIIQPITDLIVQPKLSKKIKSKCIFVPRNPTGKAAEEFFIQYHRKTSKPIIGQLRDARDLGCGYDFEIVDKGVKYFIEVKGLVSCEGSIAFTSKEWEVAQKYKEQYYLAVVYNIANTPEITLIQNPFVKLNPEKYIYTSIAIQWGVYFSKREESVKYDNK
jgi:hypothetical protein